MPKATPKTRPASSMLNQVPGTKMPSIRPTSRPMKIPDSAPAPITLAQVLRPMTRSMVFRSVPTMTSMLTGNSLSAR
ncbi:Uncharacterised protein [Mycobacteroides abscessus subsp. abscessus]|nr:Uncharacterised protein [Mycobacteroides abscessus subsp. abscessus]